MTFPHVASISRTEKTGLKYTFAVIGSTKCFLQPMSLEETQANGATYTKSSKCYVPRNADIDIGDRLTILGKEYSVSGYSLNTYGSLQHKKLMLEQA